MYTLGIDIGSTTSKCVILQDGASITARSLQLGGLGTDGPEDALTELWQESGLTRADMARVIVTGYGRNKFEGADGEVSELTCHALGGRFVFPDLRTVIDIGGQDAKIISLTPDGRMSNFIMNDKCAAGNRPVPGGHGQHSAAGYRRSGRHRRRERFSRRHLQHLHGVC